VALPGIADLNALGVAAFNTLDDLVTAHRPDRIVWVPATAVAKKDEKGNATVLQTSLRSSFGLSFLVNVVAGNHGIQAVDYNESQARAAILGRGRFHQRDSAGKIIRKTATKATKAEALAWAIRKGWLPAGDRRDDVADAMVLLEHDRRHRLADLQWGKAA